MGELRAEWDSRLTPQERIGDSNGGQRMGKGRRCDNAEQAKEYALEHSFQNASAVSEKRLKAEALTYCRRLGVARICCRYSTAPGSHCGNTGGAINGHDKDRAAR